MTPDPTPASVIRNVAQALQAEVLLAVGVLGFLVGMFVGWYSH